MTDKIIPVPKSIRKDLTGRKFGRLTVLGYVGQDAIHNAQWLCRCECGQTKTYICSRLLRKINPVRSCGCGSRESAKKHGMVATPEYNAWRSMYQRCNNPNSPGYHLYGGRGIKVCDRWRESFDNFYADMGPRPGCDYSLDRINTNGHYEPGNCRWATPTEQSNNTNVNRILVSRGQSHSLAEWSRITGISKSGLRWRLANGWTVDEALSVRPNYGNGWKATHHATSKAK